MGRKLFQNKYGYFTEDGKEYVITSPKTPKPWANAISNGDYSTIISQTGGGFSWRTSATENRITRTFQDTIKDDWGKYIYIRDEDTKDYWSAAWKPVCKEVDFYEVRHGIGYSVIKSIYKNIATSMKIFVVPNDPLEIWELEIENTDIKERKLNLFTYFEWALGDAPDINREFHKLFIDTKYNEKMNGLTAEKCMWSMKNSRGQGGNTNWPYVAFHSCSETPIAYDSDKENFIGMYSSEEHPKAMDNSKLTCKTGRYGDAIGALQVPVNLEPGEKKKIVFTLGCADSMEHADYFANRYNNIDESETAFNEVNRMWDKYLNAENINTPDNGMNIMTNIWLKYQALSCRIWGRTGYYQVNGGYGFRDQLQDSLIYLENNPEGTKDRLRIHASQQKNDGSVTHWWRPISKKGQVSRCSDDFLWLPCITIAYLKETNDFDFMDEEITYLDGGEGSIYEHCKKSINRSFAMFSPRGIPLMGAHDWNDGLSGIGIDMKGESFWVGEFLYYILSDFISIAQEKEDKNFVKKCKDICELLRTNINKYGWDGKWYLQATQDNGEKVGAKDNEQGFIYLNPQIWAVISGVADKDRAKKCMHSVSKYLLKDYGALLLFPEYSTPNEKIGYITRYAPGLRENGGVYTHAATWAVRAYAMLGDADKAYEAYRKICPPNRSNDIDTYLGEPYVTPGNSDGPTSPYYGRGSWTWFTGSAQWLHRVAVQWILGIRPNYNELIIDPCIPKEWNGFTYTRKFQDTIYVIEVDNSTHISKGVKEIIVDGVKVESNRIATFGDEKEHVVKVIMG